MSAPVLSIIILAVMFLLATVLPLNMGALAFVGAFLLGSVVLGMSTNDILANFPGGLFLTIVGVTYLFAIAQNNGTIDLLVRGAVRLVGSKVALIPWVMFAITAVITAVGALSPAAVAIIAPIALSFAAKHKINPLMMGMMVIHGAQAGGFSPIAVYGVTVNSIIAKTELDANPMAIFLASFLFNLAIALVLFVVLGGGKLLSTPAGRLVEQAAEKRLSVSVGARAAGVTLQGSGSDISAAGVSAKGTSGSGTSSAAGPAPAGAPPASGARASMPQLITILGLIAALRLPGWLGLDPRIGVAGLTASAGIAGWVEFYLLRREITRRIGSTGMSASLTMRMWLAALIAAAIGWGVKLVIFSGHTVIFGLVILAVYGVSFLLIATLMRIPEASALTARLRRR